ERLRCRVEGPHAERGLAAVHLAGADRADEPADRQPLGSVLARRGVLPAARGPATILGRGCGGVGALPRGTPATTTRAGVTLGAAAAAGHRRQPAGGASRPSRAQ